MTSTKQSSRVSSILTSYFVNRESESARAIERPGNNAFAKGFIAGNES